MLMNAALGAGSELIIDVAAGVDWTAAIAIVYGIQQVTRRPSALRTYLQSALSQACASTLVTDSTANVIISTCRWARTGQRTPSRTSSSTLCRCFVSERAGAEADAHSI